MVSRTGYQDAPKVGEFGVLKVTSLLFTDDIPLAPTKVDFWVMEQESMGQTNGSVAVV